DGTEVAGLSAEDVATEAAEIIVAATVAAVMTALGAWVFLAPNSDTGQQYLLPQDVPVLYRALIAFMLSLFAAMYAWMATQSLVPRPLLWVGAIGKGGAFLTVLALFSTSLVPFDQVSMMVGDAILSAIWFGWLFRNRKSNVAKAE
ncbi:MAG: hypothetical protein AAF387_21315, partial [Pseudomonadota bacterium]